MYIYINILKNKLEIQSQKEKFYDLVSGSEKGVLAFSLIRKFNLCIGIEFLENLTKLSIDMKHKLSIYHCE